MKMFDSKSPKFRIPVKISFVNLLDEEPDSPGLGDKKISVSDQEHIAFGKQEDCSKFLKQVKVDLQLSDSEDNNGPESSNGSSASVKKRNKNRRRKEETTKEKMIPPQIDPDAEEDTEWVKAKGKVEEFLDFPGAIAFRSQKEATRSSQITTAVSNGQLPECDSAPIPNTRHNAIFLRDNEKAKRGLQLNP
ncbi:uncharacterized protein LOC142153169 isoform X2 [Mixophyes fleayi]